MAGRRLLTVGVLVAALAVAAPPAGVTASEADSPATRLAHPLPSWLPGATPAGAADAAARAAARDARAAAETPGGARLVETTDLVPCTDDPSFLCGTVPVPLDRRNPDGRTVGVHVEVLPHSGGSERPRGAVLVTCGGPGCSITAGPKFGFAFFLLPEVSQTRDLVFVDQRGVGLSEVIDCPALQAGGPFYRSAARCHDRLGDRANLYSTTDVADDLEDVRRALGYRRLDLFGGSYAGPDMMTYAVRHRRHVRSVVLSSPAVVVGSDPFFSYAPKAMPQMVAGLCGRSPACAAAHARPARALAGAARALRRHPVRGTGRDSSGAPHRLTVTENLLVNHILWLDGPHFLGAGEILQAMSAARRGDTVPLLRLAADVDPSVPFVEDPRVFSVGHSLARYCVDAEVQWDKDAPGVRRVRQYRAARAAQPRFYGPFSKRAWVQPGLRGFQPSNCIASRWQDRPMYRPDARVRGVPTLVLGGEYDLPVPEALARTATEVMVDSTYVSMKAAGHDPQFWSECGPEIVQPFILNRAVGDLSCAEEPAGGWWVPGAFPARVRHAPPARQVSGDPVGAVLRRRVTAAMWTTLDSVQHSIVVLPEPGAGLRGGSVVFEPTDTGARWTLTAARFTRDSAVDGEVVGTGPLLEGEVTLTGRSGWELPLSFSGELFVDGEDFVVTVQTARGQATFAVPAY